MEKEELTLLIMAAGMGSRYGGLKQIEPIGPNGEFLIDYSIYDAIKAGFNKVVFIIKEENYDIFRKTIGKRVEDKIKTEYVFQNIDNLPNGYRVPNGREKPWGTAHAILCAKNNINGPFAIINADDLYGTDAYFVASNFLRNVKEDNNYCIVGYKVKNTLTEYGAAKRGVCNVKDGNLIGLIESNVERIDGKIIAKPLDGRNPFEVDEDMYVSMNMLCFTPSIFNHIESRFEKFLDSNKENILTCEYLIPDLLEKLTLEGITTTKVIPTTAKWEGITYKEDKERVVESIKKLVYDRKYPYELWKK